MKRSPAIASLAASALLAACAWSVPADPGANARLRSGSASDRAAPSADRAGRAASRAADDGARSIYMNRCSKCHEPFAPSHASPGEWPALVRRYGPRAGLFGDERERVLRWLQANAR